MNNSNLYTRFVQVNLQKKRQTCFLMQVFFSGVQVSCIKQNTILSDACLYQNLHELASQPETRNCIRNHLQLSFLGSVKNDSNKLAVFTIHYNMLITTLSPIHTHTHEVTATQNYPTLHTIPANNTVTLHSCSWNYLNIRPSYCGDGQSYCTGNFGG